MDRRKLTPTIAKTAVAGVALCAALAVGLPRAEAGRSGGHTHYRQMTFNIRFDFPSDGDNRWARRADVVAKTIREGGALVACLQEDKEDQVADLQQRLPGWEFFGRGRNPNGSGERCAIAWQTAHVRATDRGEFWLSDTPDVQGSNTFGDEYPRKCTWAVLEVDRSHTPVLVMNTHMPEGEAAASLRVREVRVMREFLEHKVPARERANLAVVLCGDYNAGADEAPRAELAGGAAVPLRDAWVEASPRDPHPGTIGDFTGFQGTKRIDWILLGGPVHALAAHKLDQQVDGRWPSDHYPVLADLELR